MDSVPEDQIKEILADMEAMLMSTTKKTNESGEETRTKKDSTMKTLNNNKEKKSKKKSKKKKKSRCYNCNKKVGLTGFECRCDSEVRFCDKCRHSDVHNCTFDYAFQHKELLAKQNIRVVADKLRDRIN